MNAPAPKPDTDQEPSFFHGSGYLVDEIILGLSVLQAKVRNLKQGNATWSAVQQKLAAEDVSKVSGQITMMADTVARVTISHLNRRARV